MLALRPARMWCAFRYRTKWLDLWHRPAATENALIEEAGQELLGLKGPRTSLWLRNPQRCSHAPHANRNGEWHTSWRCQAEHTNSIQAGHGMLSSKQRWARDTPFYRELHDWLTPTPQLQTTHEHHKKMHALLSELHAKASWRMWLERKVQNEQLFPTKSFGATFQQQSNPTIPLLCRLSRDQLQSSKSWPRTRTGDCVLF